MRLVTYASGPNGLPRLGVRVGHRVLDVEAASRVDGEPLPSSMKGLLREGRGALSRVQALAKAAQSNAGRYSTAMMEEKAIRFLPPVPDPDRFVGMDPTPRTQPDEAGTSFGGHNGKIATPSASARLDCRPALVFVIGRRAGGVTGDDDAMDYVAGVTLLSELIASDSAPDASLLGAIGPELVTIDEIGDPDDLWITCVVNGEERLRVNAGDQAGKMSEILVHFSRDAALEPGDMFSTGIPGSFAPGSDDVATLKVGDVVECSIEGITTLRTTITAA
ncbi:MAG: fumarylacetoacetate hydrolase family protein [Usitatibacter sp.]